MKKWIYIYGERKIKMNTFRRNFKKIVFGSILVEADNVEEAEAKFNEDEYDEFDNKSEYEFEEWINEGE